MTNKISQNLHAELFLRVVGREKTGVGSTAAGLQVEREFLKSAGVAEGDVVLRDGSGLSRDDLVTPRAVVTLLRYASHQPWGREFISTLPVAGMDGTLVDHLLERGIGGLVIEGFGAGNVPPGIVPSLEKAIQQNIPVVLTTHGPEGGVWPMYAYPGGGADLVKRGVILGGRLSGSKARIKLMAALGAARDMKKVRQIFERTA